MLGQVNRLLVCPRSPLRFGARGDVANGTRTAPNSADGLAAAEVCAAIERSAASRVWEDVPVVAGGTTV